MEVEDSDLCTIGNTLKEQCNKLVYTKTVSVTIISDLPQDNLKLLKLRTGINDFTKDDVICKHHKKKYISMFENLQRYCCDPFKQHKRKIAKSLRVAKDDIILKLQLKPGQKLCPTCTKKASSEDPAEFESDVPSDTSSCYNPTPDKCPQTRAELDSSISSLGVSPLKSVSDRDKKGYAKQKIVEIQKAATSKVARVLDINPDEASRTPSTFHKCEHSTLAKDYLSILSDIKLKFATASNAEKKKLLTLAPSSWSIKKIAEEFKVGERIVRDAIKLKKSNGILSDPNAKRGRPISEVIKKRVQNFYSDDRFSRLCPGKKDFKTVRTSEGRIHIQKRLLLTDIKNLRDDFMKETGDRISIGKFFELRPEWCIPVGPKGTHNVCICHYHQNAKLMLHAIPSLSDSVPCTDVLGKMVCNIHNRECMLHFCEDCPGVEGLETFIQQLFSENDIEDYDTITFQQWTHTDRTTLVTMQMSVNEFTEKLCSIYKNLREHHYIAKAQSSFLRQTKEDLPHDVAVILLDFAENYSFIVQDAVQGHHWNNSQVTLHPFVMYFKEDAELKSTSFCCLSDHMDHDTSAVHSFQKVVLDFIKSENPQIKKIMYMSDGAGSQYKNYKNIINLCNHITDFGMPAEWHFFGTSHGKSPCDGVGGTVKRLVARHSLQAPLTSQILTAEDMFTWATSNISGINFFLLTHEDVLRHSDLYKLETRYQNVKTIPGTRSHHAFIPTVSTNTLVMKRISADQFGNTLVMPMASLSLDITTLLPGKYIACIYDEKWFIGNITERSEEHSDVNTMFMCRNENTPYWPTKEDKCWIPFSDVLCLIEAPALQGNSGRQYSLQETIKTNIEMLFSERKSVLNQAATS